ncbi:glutamyl-tRNA reductase [Sulfurimonas sp.]|uniref:glutamyl-tRNA reductase n=1 Tax=Sulfurimonas sp. TaxID=2022749 RepID=UPI002615DDC5|nr:glutamyl-tRNA reductase [Sulfurimonas sp.]
MHYLTISFSHKNSDIAFREKLAYSDTEKESCLKKLLQSPHISEAVLVSTCNRMEFFVTCSDIKEATNHISTLLELKSQLSRDELIEHAEIVDDSMAIHHLFAVASSIDSMVVGETQIAGQLKDAFRFSQERGYSDKKISRAMSHAFKCAAKVRNFTDISSKPVSVASVAIGQIKAKVDNLSQKKALVIGVGEMSEICAKHLISDGVETYITNRTKHNAETLAKECAAKVYDFGDLHKAVNEFDIIFTATSASYPIITEDLIEKKEFKRFWFDLAIPRDIDISQRDDIYLFVVDDIEEIIDENKAEREKYVRQAHGIVGKGVVEFYEWLDALNVEPIIKEIYIKAHEAAAIETQRVLSKGFIPKEYEAEVKKMAEQTVKRFLHEMTKKMRDASHEAKSDTVTGAFQYILNEKNDNIPDKYQHYIKK